jgi:hypothetical protein
MKQVAIQSIHRSDDNFILDKQSNMIFEQNNPRKRKWEELHTAQQTTLKHNSTMYVNDFFLLPGSFSNNISNAII